MIDKKLTEYNKNGWTVIRNFFSKKEIENYENKIQNFLTKKINSYSGRDINFVSNKKEIREINSFHKMHDLSWVRQFSKQKKILILIKKFLNSSPELRASELFFKPKKIGLPAPDHQDNFYWKVKNNNALTIWISLSRSDHKNGGIHYYNGSHKFGILRHKPSFAKGSSQKVHNRKFLKKFKKCTPKLNKGDILVHHVLVVHGSKKNLSNRSRKGWTLQFKDKNSVYDKKAIKLYEKNLYKQIGIRDKCQVGK